LKRVIDEIADPAAPVVRVLIEIAPLSGAHGAG